MNLFDNKLTIGEIKKNRGYEYKSKGKLFGIPLLHISFRFKQSGQPVPAIGIISIGQFGMGVINISQFGLGLFSLSQFTVGAFVIAQVSVCYTGLFQAGMSIDKGVGQFVYSLTSLI